MIKLEITVQPKRVKYLEFSQSLEFIKADLGRICKSLVITIENKVFQLHIEMESTEQLTRVLYSHELSILSGAIRMLAEKSEVTIHGIGHKRKGSDLREIRLNYLKRNKKPIVQ